MDHYIEIILNPDAEMRENVLLNKVYTKLHKALYSLNAKTIGVSFPKATFNLGRNIRIHGEYEKLQQLQQLNWIGGLIGYCNVSEISQVPDSCKYQTVSRVQSTMSKSKLNRLVNRGSITETDIKTYKSKMFEKGLQYPYLELESASNENKYRRYISISSLQDSPVVGDFDSFGLSRTATIPVF